MLISGSLITNLIIFVNAINAQDINSNAAINNNSSIATAVVSATSSSAVLSSSIPFSPTSATSATTSTPVTNTAVSSKAQSLGLNSTWKAPMPSTVISPASDYLTANWFAKQGFYGANDVNFIEDPFSTNSTSPVLQVNYPAGSYAPIGLQSNGIKGGAEFFSEVDKGKSYNTALLSYDVAFDSSFNWFKGGKLPGIYGGSPGVGCSGGEKATGANCFSVRLMWRESGAGEAYAYIPTSSSLCSSKQVLCNSDYGTSFSRGVIQFSTKKWTHMDIYIRLNTGSNTNGILQVWQDGSLMINQQHLQFRTSDTVGISTMMFSTFFGGGTADYATPINTSTYFKNFQFSAGDTPDPTQGNIGTILTANNYIITAATIVVLSFFFI